MSAYLERARAWILREYDADQQAELDMAAVDVGASRLAAEFQRVSDETREECAKECEAVAADCRLSGERYIATECAGSIRDMGEPAALDPRSTTAPCTRPPTGWRCTRAPDHEGPCAAVPASGDSGGGSNG